MSSWLQGELVNAVDMWVDPSKQAAAIKKYGDIQHWDVSQVTNMAYLFSPTRAIGNTTVRNGLTSFNGNIRNWDVSKVTHINGMFYYATTFNQSLDQWDVSGVKDMRSMFEEATSFNQPMGQWNVSEVTSMGKMFTGATSFNQPLGQWNVSGVTNMGGMFQRATAFMANGANYTHTTNGISKWRPLKITNNPTNPTNSTYYMFKGINSTPSSGIQPVDIVWQGLVTQGLIDNNGTVTLAGIVQQPTGMFYKP